MSDRPALLAALHEGGPQSARDVAVTLGESTSRSNVAAIRARLEKLERRGLVQRAQHNPSGPWIWEVADGSDQP